MTSYSFDRRFVPAILAGTKAQTIRSPRKNQVKAGGTVHIFTGLRTKHTRRIGAAVCREVTIIRLELSANKITDLYGTRTRLADLDHFAKGDGFPGWLEMKAFWAKEHPGVDCWEGDLIKWTDFKPHEEPAHD